MPTKAQLLDLGADERNIIDRETHPAFSESSVPLTSHEIKWLGAKGLYHLCHLRPMSVFVAVIGNMWVEHGHHRLQDMLVSMETKGYTVAIEEIKDGCVLPMDHMGQMRTEATYLALDSGAEWLFMVENDVLLELDTLERLMAWDFPVVFPYINDLEQRYSTDVLPLSGPRLKPRTGLYPVLWAVNSAMLFNTRVFNAVGPDVWGDHYGINEYQLAQKLNHVGHRIYVDTNTVVDVARSPTRHRAWTWDELWDHTRKSFDKSRNEERDRRPPPGMDPAFTNGQIAPSGAYVPLGRSLTRSHQPFTDRTPQAAPSLNRAERRRLKRAENHANSD